MGQGIRRIYLGVQEDGNDDDDDDDDDDNDDAGGGGGGVLPSISEVKLFFLPQSSKLRIGP